MVSTDSILDRVAGYYDIVPEIETYRHNAVGWRAMRHKWRGGPSSPR